MSPNGKLRFALTSRFVKPEKYKNDVWKGEYEEDPSYHYDGDEHSRVESGAACSFVYPGPKDAAGAGGSEPRPAEVDPANVPPPPSVDAAGSPNGGDSSSLSSLTEPEEVQRSDASLQPLAGAE